ncbi:carboxypeptidase A6 [Crotalus adamanteus]|uniref:Carboxypeptidase A6 n=1 Tax=Crotalus adamanteus TaxID=8729 RepID=A0AAW1BLS8_CROAD
MNMCYTGLTLPAHRHPSHEALPIKLSNGKKKQYVSLMEKKKPLSNPLLLPPIPNLVPSEWLLRLHAKGRRSYHIFSRDPAAAATMKAPRLALSFLSFGLLLVQQRAELSGLNYLYDNRYAGHKVIRIIPENDQMAETLKILSQQLKVGCCTTGGPVATKQPISHLQGCNYRCTSIKK